MSRFIAKPSQPKVSVIIAVFNGAPWICEALESVLSQTYSNLEIIVVDDGSTDGTHELLKSYSGTLTHIRQSNCGQPSARNIGIRRSTGDLIAFVDADDRWMPE